MHAYTKKFLSLFGTNKTYCYSSGQKSMVNTGNLNTVLDANKTRNADAYFYINNGGTKQNEITRLIACFIDIDAGRKVSGRYLDRGQVNIRKIKMRDAIEKCPLKPSVVVETRNGYQLYWVFPSPVSANKFNLSVWNNTQRAICKYFESVGGDNRALKVNQVFRVPGTYWRKVYEKTNDTFLTTILNYKFKPHILVDIHKTFSSTRTPLASNSRITKTKKTWKGKSATGWDTVYNKVDKSTGYITPENTYTSECDVKAFLRDVAQVLYMKKLNFLSQTAWKLYNTFDMRYKERK